MKMWDNFHDLNPKTLLNGVTLPARTATTNGAAGLADVNAAVDCLFNHTNVAPLIGRQLIQRLVTSNPSTGYVARVAAAFNNNGSGVRGDLKAVIKAILLDAEARDPQFIDGDAAGKLHGPEFVAMMRAFHRNTGARMVSTGHGLSKENFDAKRLNATDATGATQQNLMGSAAAPAAVRRAPAPDTGDV
jgi:uncharacterized protein (DUF1800 family)